MSGEGSERGKRGATLEEEPLTTLPPRKTRSLPRILSGEAVHPGGGRCHVGDREARIAVMGDAGVGKTALVVRYITKRYIGDYAHYETTTCFTATIDCKPTRLNILDTTGELQNETITDNHLQWAEGIMLVFSVTDRDTFTAIQPMVEQITRSRDNKRPPIIIIGNKSDLCHLREVSESAGKKLGKRLCCPYRETSASDSYDSVSEAFTCIFREVQNAQRKTKKNSSSKIAQIRETLRSLTDFRVRTNTF